MANPRLLPRSLVKSCLVWKRVQMGGGGVLMSVIGRGGVLRVAEGRRFAAARSLYVAFLALASQILGGREASESQF